RVGLASEISGLPMRPGIMKTRFGTFLGFPGTQVPPLFPCLLSNQACAPVRIFRHNIAFLDRLQRASACRLPAHFGILEVVPSTPWCKATSVFIYTLVSSAAMWTKL